VSYFLKIVSGLKKLALIVVGVAVGLVLMLFKRNKDMHLRQKEEQELIEAQKRKQQMEAIWTKQ
jgi:uncharacterized membrane-anchored protein YhcB (DUF1043 family)